jgi:hypothetical protein
VVLAVARASTSSHYPLISFALKRAQGAPPDGRDARGEMGRKSRRSKAGTVNQKKAADDNVSDGAHRVYSFGVAEGKCHVQALAREVEKIEKMREKMREHDKKTDLIEKLANKTKDAARFKVSVAPGQPLAS